MPHPTQWLYSQLVLELISIYRVLHPRIKMFVKDYHVPLKKANLSLFGYQV